MLINDLLLINSYFIHMFREIHQYYSIIHRLFLSLIIYEYFLNMF